MILCLKITKIYWTLLDPLNIAARYPEQIEKSLQHCLEDRCKVILTETE